MWITKNEIQKNKLTHLYIYSDDKTQKAYRGQAETFYGYNNALPIFTRLWPCMDSSNPASHWCSVPIELAKQTITRLCFEPIQARITHNPGLIIVVVPKIGEGCARLKSNNPELFKFIKEFLESIRIE